VLGRPNLDNFPAHMKSKSVRAVLLLGALLTVAHADDTPASILSTNPGFEDGMNGWNVTNEDAAQKLSQVVPEAAHTGKNGLRVQQTASQTGSWAASPQVPVVAQQTYRISFWVRTLIDSHAAVFFKFVGADGTNSVDTAKPPVNTLQVPGGIYDWQECHFDVQAPAGAVGASVAVHAYNHADCQADFDDFSVTPVTP
jgi:hypothetical protein